MNNESKIESLKELIADAKAAISDPALAGIYKTEIKGHIAKAEKQIEKLARETFMAGLLVDCPKLSKGRRELLWLNYSQDADAVCCEALARLTA